MSFEKKEEKGKITFLGKKTELTNNLNDLLESNKCKLCGISKDLIKCKKCSYNFCKDCIKQKNHTFLQSVLFSLSFNKSSVILSGTNLLSS